MDDEKARAVIGGVFLSVLAACLFLRLVFLAIWGG